MTTTLPVDKSEARVRQMFGEIAGRYDLMNHVLSGGTDVYWRWRTVRAVAPSGTAPILDVCTGTGDLALAYWKAGRGQVSVEATDFTPEMLRLAEVKRDRQFGKQIAGGAASLNFTEADTQTLPFEDDRFQIVSVAFGLRNVTDTERGLREMLNHNGNKTNRTISETAALLRNLANSYCRASEADR